MIGKLKGRVDSTDEDSVLLDVNGVGYEVFCAGRTLAGLKPNEVATLVIETHVREDHIHLYGFPNGQERDWFRLLMTVQGVGVRMALAILNLFPPAELQQTIAAKDVKSLTRVSGVGPKVAERLTTELKNKVGALPSGPSVIVKGTAKGAQGAALPPPSIAEDALSALVNLGYPRAQAYGVVASAAHAHPDATLDVLIRESLKDLAR